MSSVSLYVGIDLGIDNCVVKMLGPQGEELTPRALTFGNDAVGGEELVASVVHQAERTGATEVHIGMEATNLFWWHLHEFLSHHEALAWWEPKLYVVNPALIDGFKRAYPKMPKTDAIDAWVIADRIRFGRLKPTPAPDMRYAPLARLTRHRYHLVRHLTAEKNRALGLLFLKFSTYGREHPFGDTFGAASRALIETYTPDELAAMDLHALARFIAERGKHRFSRPVEELAEELKTAARRAFRLHPKMQSTVDVTFSMSLESVRFFEAQLRKLDRVIAQELRAIPQTLATVPGIGPVYAAGIVAEIGDISRFPDHAALASYAGLTWTQYQSSHFTADDTALTRAGNFYLRYYLVEAANQLRVRSPEFARYYQSKVAEVPKHAHKRALVLTARKLVRLVFALLSKGQVYRERRVAP